MIVSFQVTRDCFNGNKKIYRILRNVRMEYNSGQNEGNMESWHESIILFVAISLMMGAMFKFMWSRLDKKFESIDRKLDAISLDIKVLDKRVSRLEGQEEERFRNELKIFIKERND